MITWNENWRSRDWTPSAVSDMYRLMVRCRAFEEEGKARYVRGDFIGPYHSSVGQEATHVGACVALGMPGGFVTSTHRSHGHQIAKGAALPGLAAEIWGKATGVCKGKGGSMHVADFSVGALGASGVLAGGLGIGTGAALAQKLDGTDKVVICFFGEGAINEGIWHETLNWASLWKLPIIFVCENNNYAVTMSFRDITAIDLVSKRAVAYNMPGETVDGQNVLEVVHACEGAVQRARDGYGPTLLECLTYRYEEHSLRMVLPKDREGAIAGVEYRSDDEIAQWKARDPIQILRTWSLNHGLLTSEDMDAMDREQADAAASAWDFADASPWPDEEEIWVDTWSVPVSADARVPLR